MSVSRDRDLIRALLSRVRACGLVRAVLLCTDGLASYPKAAIHLFKEPLQGTSSESLFAPASWVVRGSSCRRASWSLRPSRGTLSAGSSV